MTKQRNERRTGTSVSAVRRAVWRATASRIAGAALLAGLLAGAASTASAADQTEVERGKYLVTIGSCNDCHTPGYFLGKPDMTRFLGGSDVGFELQGLGTFHGRNLTPDRETGIGEWTVEQIVTVLQTGVRPDGRILAPIMPWRAFASFTPADARAIAVYLKSLPPVHNKVPGPFAVGQPTGHFVMRLVSPDKP